MGRCPTCGCAYEPTGLTAKQAAILKFVLAFHGKHGRFPPYTAIADRFGYSALSTVKEHVDNLVRGGWLSLRDDGNDRRRAIIGARPLA